MNTINKYLNTSALLILISLFAVGSHTRAQESVGIGTLTPDNSAVLHLQSGNQGFLMTTLDSNAISAIAAPAEGLIVYNTDDGCYWYHNSWWKRICSTDTLGDIVVNSIQGDTAIFNYGQFDTIYANYINVNVIEGDTAIFNYAYIDSLFNTYINSQYIDVDSLYANYINVNYIEGDTAIFNWADIDSLFNTYINSQHIDVDSIFATYINVQNIEGDTLTFSWADIDSLFFNNAIGDSLWVNYINANFGDFDSIHIDGNNILNIISDSLQKAWLLEGNTVAFNDFMGSVNNMHVAFRTNNIERMRLSETGKFHFNYPFASTPTFRLQDAIFAVMGNAPTADWPTSNTNRFFIDNTKKSLFLGRSIAAGNWAPGNVGLNNITIGRVDVGPDGGFTYSDNIALGDNSTLNGYSNFMQGQGLTVEGQYMFVSGISNNVTNADRSMVYGNNITMTSGSVNKGFVFGGNITFGDGPGLTFNSLYFGDGGVLYGTNNIAFGNQITISGGSTNFSHGSLNTFTNSSFSTSYGTSNTIDGGSISFVYGSSNNVTAPNTFTYGTALTNSTPGMFMVQFTGGYNLYSSPANTTGVFLAPGSGTWASISDVNQKTNIVPLENATILDKIGKLDVSQWSYVSQTVNGQAKTYKTLDENGNEVERPVPASSLYTKDIMHIGPMAQDFYSLFNLGVSETKITALDVSGVALAGVKALKEENEMLKEELKSMNERIEALEKALNSK